MAPAARARSHEAAAQFTALIFARAFEPLSKALGFYGDVVVANATLTLARSERGLTGPLERALEAASESNVRAEVAR